MAKIDVYSSEMSDLSGRLKRIDSVIEDAERITGKVQRNLDFQVAAKQGIASGLRTTRGKLQRQNDKVENLSKLTAVSLEEFVNADNRMDRKGRSILGRIRNPVSGIVRDIKSFFVGISLSKYQKITSLFAPAGTIITVAGLAELIRRLREIIKGAKPGGGSAGAGNTEGTVNVGGTNGSTEEQTPSGNLKPYQGKYGNYNVVNGFDPKYLLNQSKYNILNSKGKNVGCMACGVAMMQYMRTGNMNLSPEDSRIWNKRTKETQWTFIKKVPDSGKRSKKDQLKILYDNLQEGTPVMIALSSSKNKYSTHYVVVVGIREGADVNNLQKSDFLVADPNGGVIRTIDEAEKKVSKVMRDGDNFTMWKANNKGY